MSLKITFPIAYGGKGAKCRFAKQIAKPLLPQAGAALSLRQHAPPVAAAARTCRGLAAPAGSRLPKAPADTARSGFTFISLCQKDADVPSAEPNAM